MERNNERKRWNHRLQGSELEKDKTINPLNPSQSDNPIYNLQLLHVKPIDGKVSVFLNHLQEVL